MEAGAPLGQVCHYIHLNPVRAGICGVGELADYRYGSYWYLTRPKQRPDFLQPETALREAGELADTKAGWASYAQYLGWQAAEGPAGRNKAYVTLSKGWALGGQKFKRTLLRDHAVAVTARAWESIGAKEMRQAQWQEMLDRGLRHLGRRAEDIRQERKSAPWKVALAAWLKQHSQVDNRWLCERLHMGTPVGVSHHVGQARRQAEHPAVPLLHELTLNIKT